MKSLHSRPSRLLIPLLSLVVSALASPVAAQWTVVGLNPEGSTHSEAVGASATQQTGFCYNHNGMVIEGGVWGGTAASWIGLGPHVPGAWASWTSASAGSQQVGMAAVQYIEGRIADGPFAALWNGTANSWVDLHPEVALRSEALGTSGDQQVGYAEFDGQSHAALWSGTAESWVDLHPAGATQSRALGTSGTQQVGFAYFGGIKRAGTWNGTAGSWTDLHPTTASESEAIGVSGDRQVGTALFGTTQRAVLWNGSPDSWVNLTPPSATNSRIRGASGSLQVGDVTIDGVTRAGLWSGWDWSWVDLSVAAPGQWIGTSARSVWSDGTTIYVAGHGSNSTGQTEALLWTAPVSVLPCLADVGRAGGFAGQDGQLDNNDFAAFIALFFSLNSRADLGRQGGRLGADGHFDNNDFIAFINQFFAGCQ